jgi:uncharacterized protein with NRDE domain
VCLLVFAWQVGTDYPLVVAANRDERLDRPSDTIVVLQEAGPRVLGGRDLLAGGTWLAVNEDGVVAGLTNRPSPGGRDPAKRSRGELPLMIAGRPTAEQGVAEIIRRVEPDRYNPAWLLVADRQSLFSIELGGEQAPVVHALEPGVHVLENVALTEPSPKVDRIGALLSAADGSGRTLWQTLPSVLSDHVVPAALDGRWGDEQGATRPPATLAACVHTEEYGTRSAALIRVPARAAGRPEVRVADGPPCTTPFVDAGGYWDR